MNGAEAIISRNPAIEEMCETIPHFGDCWKKEIYADITNPGKQIVMFTPPARLGPLTPPRFFSTLGLMTPKGPAQVEFEIFAATLELAAAGWRAAAQDALRKAEEAVRENTKRIIVPEPANVPFPKKVLN